jgi:L-aminopeptidase/D-esterase-like protein
MFSGEGDHCWVKRHAEGMHAGASNTITDVPGLRVGHTTLDGAGWLTGTTVVVPPPRTTCGVDVRGGGPGTRETDALDPRTIVDAVDAVVLSGGSAFGLATADGVAREAYAAGAGWPIFPDAAARVPIVPAAILFDLGRGGTWLHHPGPDDGAAAYRDATADPVPQGNVGAGTGCVAGGLRGGLGSASAVLSNGVTVGALVACNAVGSTMAPDGNLFATRWGLPGEFDRLPGPDPDKVAAHWADRAAEVEAMRAGTATTIAVIATDATLTKAGCQKLAGVTHDGMARAISPVHTPFDGDTVFALATGVRNEPTGPELVELFDAAASCLTRAIGHGILAATSVDRSAEGGVTARSWRESVTR